ncbi:carboxylic ester hydrolase [Plakobranchus ocellatus]|uniref:Carboxylic ester hydrolase n=1 Tax=Plakobranchus ocellatus TaxID=259542 RepID=A0AAV3YE32_9GAST|nr:carboxylic ester hydrolase [Plakobranchus ocellatus]
MFIHGGGFVVGSSRVYLPGTFINAHDIVFVTINYRIGVLGFLSTEDDASIGNYGLWDMVMALQWVKNNIEAFGGDSEDVTISGESAGGSAVSYLTLAPAAKNLFTKVYAQSGTATSMFGRATRARKTALELASSLGCFDGELAKNSGLETSKAILACLRKLPFRDFTKFTAFGLDESKFVPRVDGEFVLKDPLVLFNDTKYLKSVGFFDKAHLVAMDNNERSIIKTHLKLNEYMLINHTGATGAYAQNMIKGLYDSARRFYVGTRLNSPQPSELVMKTVKSWYDRRFGSEALTELMSDLSFLVPTLDYIEATAKEMKCDSWLLYFNHYPEILKGNQRGMPHSFELLYWFDFPLEMMKVFLSDRNIEEMGEEDLKLKHSFAALIATFVKTGNPSNALMEHIPGGVPSYDTNKRSYIEFSPSPSLGFNLESAKREFWMRLSSAYNSDHIISSNV